MQAAKIVRLVLFLCCLVGVIFFAAASCFTAGKWELGATIACIVAIVATPFVGRWAMPNESRKSPRLAAGACYLSLFVAGFWCGETWVEFWAGMFAPVRASPTAAGSFVAEEWHPNRRMKSRVHMRKLPDGTLVKEGISETWKEDGRPDELVNYVAGVTQGTRIKWAGVNRPHQITQVGNGVPNGLYLRLNIDGQIDVIGNMENGKQSGPWTYWYPNGQKGAEFTCVEGRKEGLWRAWHSNGILREEGSYGNGAQDGRWRFWDECGAPKPAEVWSNGERVKGP